jgi:hypothetical protein
MILGSGGKAVSKANEVSTPMKFTLWWGKINNKQMREQISWQLRTSAIKKNKAN